MQVTQTVSTQHIRIYILRLCEETNNPFNNFMLLRNLSLISWIFYLISPGYKNIR